MAELQCEEYFLKLLIRNSMTIKCIATVRSINSVGFGVLKTNWNTPCVSVMCHQVAITYIAGEACSFKKDATKLQASSSLLQENNV